MSGRLCNWCLVRIYRGQASAGGLMISVVPAAPFLGLEPPGWDVFLHDVYTLPTETHKLAWLWTIGDCCEC